MLALTGGIATGKSTVGRMIKSLIPSLSFFDCDESVARILKRPEIVDQLAVLYGAKVLDSSGQLDRSYLRESVFSDAGRRHKLERLIHPIVREECLEQLEKSAKQKKSSLFVADVPLLYENGFEFGQQISLVVACSSKTQRTRLKVRNRFDDKLISSILVAQMPILDKVMKADVVFWNEGPQTQLELQVSRFLQII